jgi:site-specific DNA recombinase
MPRGGSLVRRAGRKDKESLRGPDWGAVVAGWIGETTAIKRAGQARLGLTEAPPERMNEDQIAVIVEALGGLLGLLKGANRSDRAEIYSRIGLRMTYRPGTETMLAEVVSSDLDGVPTWCPRTDKSGIHTVITSTELTVSG